MPRSSEDFPSAIEAVFLVLTLFAAEYLFGAVLWDVHSSLGLAPEDLPGLSVVLGNGLVFSLLLVYKQMSYASLFHPSNQPATRTALTLVIPVLLLIPGMTLAVWTAESLLVWAFPMSDAETAMFEQMMSGGIASVITVCILAPFLEEMLFRGIILRSFLVQYPRSHAIIGSAALFGLAHLNIYQFVVGFLFGLVAGWLYERARSLWPSILLHAGFNAVAVWSYHASVSEPVGDYVQAPPAYWLGAFVLSFIGLTLLQHLLPKSGECLTARQRR